MNEKLKLLARPKTVASPLPKSPSLKFECEVGYPLRKIAGVDEVGRGCLAGPVVAGAVILPPTSDLKTAIKKYAWISEIQDSKLLKAETRERLSSLIMGWALAWSIGVASVEEIDQINIFHASHLAMARAVAGLKVQPDHILVDGKFLPKQIQIPATAIVKGDLQCLSIAAASIIAKVWRDQHMTELDAQYPGYGLSKHKGYPTPVHAKALREIGVTPIHRRSFATVAENA